MSRLAFALLATCALTGVAHATDAAPANTPGSIPMRSTLTADLHDGMFAHGGEGRSSDHMVVHDLYVVQMLQPVQFTEPHGWHRVLATVPAALAIPAGTQCRMAS